MPEDVKSGDLAALRSAAVYLVAGDRDEFATPDRVADEITKLETAGVSPTRFTFDGGHRLDDETLRLVAGA